MLGESIYVSHNLEVDRGYSTAGNGRWSSLMLKKKKKPGSARRQKQVKQQQPSRHRDEDSDDEQTRFGGSDDEDETANRSQRPTIPKVQPQVEDEDESPAVPLPRCK